MPKLKHQCLGERDDDMREARKRRRDKPLQI